MVAFSKPKRKFRIKATKVATDIFEDVVRTEVLPLGLADIKVCLKAVIRKRER